MDDQKALEEERKEQAQRDNPNLAPHIPPRHHINFNTFFNELVDGTKYATTRKPREIYKGNTIDLYWEKDLEALLKPCHHINMGEVTEIIKWVVPEDPDGLEWREIYGNILVGDCWFQDKNIDQDMEETPPWGWTPREAWERYVGWYGIGSDVMTIRYRTIMLKTPLERLLLKRLYQLMQIKGG